MRVVTVALSMNSTGKENSTVSTALPTPAELPRP
jgi:hypothetical protein